MRISDWSSDVCSSDLDADGRSIGQDHALPNHQRAALAEGHDAIVTADEPRTLRDEQASPSYAVIDIFRNLRRHQPRKIGVEAGNQAGGDDAARLERTGRDGERKSVG